MLRKTFSHFALALAAICITSAEEVEITGTFQIQIACADNYHEEIPMLTVPGKSKFNPTEHPLKIDAETKTSLRIGQEITVKGKKHKETNKKMTKGQVRKAVFQHAQQGEGLPIHCNNISQIISKIQTNKPEAGVGASRTTGGAGFPRTCDQALL